MRARTAAFFMAAVLVLLSSVAVAHHVAAPPPVSRGGELAYVRDYPAAGTSPSPGEWHMDATYVSFSLHQADGLVTGFTSNGRFGDAEIFSEIHVPASILGGDRKFHVVQNHARGLLEAGDGAGRLLVLNGVNAGLGVQANAADILVTFVVAEGRTISGSGDHLYVGNDGHTYKLSLSDCPGGSFAVDNMTVAAAIPGGCEVRGWLGGFPATTEVMHWAFDHA